MIRTVEKSLDLGSERPEFKGVKGMLGSDTSEADPLVRSWSSWGGQRSSHDRLPYWILVENEPPLRVFTLRAADDALMFPVFSSREEADCFVAEALQDLGDFKVRESAGGELISLLSAPLRGVRRVALDPPTGYSPEVLELVCVGRRLFLDRLLGRGRPWLENSRSRTHSGRLVHV